VRHIWTLSLKSKGTATGVTQNRIIMLFTAHKSDTVSYKPLKIFTVLIPYQPTNLLYIIVIMDFPGYTQSL